MADDKFVCCAGCGAQCRDEYGYRIMLETSTGLEVPVCANLRNTNPHPKMSCIQKARQKITTCPGCGGTKRLLNAICISCSTKLARDDGKEVHWYYLSEKILGPYIRGDDNVLKQATLLLVQIAAGGRRWGARASRYDDCNPMRTIGGSEGHSGMPVVELDDEQAVAFKKLGAQLAAVMKAQYEVGRCDGDDLLRRLAKGEVKPTDYEQWSPKRKYEE